MRNKTFLKTIVRFLLLFAVFTINPSFKTPFPAEETSHYTIAVVMDLSAVNSRFMWDNTALFLKDRIKGADFRIVPVKYDELEQVVAKGGVDFFISNPVLYIQMEQKYGAERIATRERGSADLGQYPFYGGVVFVWSGRNDILGLKDLKGKSVAAVDELALAGWIAPYSEFRKAGVDPLKDFSRLAFMDDKEEVVYSVLRGDFDAGIVDSSRLEDLAKRGKINLGDFAVLRAEGAAGKPDFPFLCTTPLYPEWAFAKTRETPREISEKVTQALLSLIPEDLAAVTGRYAGWTIPLNYEPVRELLKELRIDPYEDYGKITLPGVIRQYWYLILASGIVFIVLSVLLGLMAGLNRKLTLSEESLKKENIKRRSAERQVSDQNLFLNNVIESISHPFYVVDAKDRTVRMRNAACGPSGTAQNDKCYHISHRTLEPCCGKEYHCPLEEVVAAKKPVTAEHIHYDSDGNPLHVEVHAYPVFGESGEVVQVIVYSLDISERKKAQEELEDANRKLAQNEVVLRQMLANLQTTHNNLKNTHLQLLRAEKLASIGQLAAGVAHEINNPTGFIANNLATLEKYTKSIVKILKAYGQVKKAVAGKDLHKAARALAEVTLMEEELDLEFILRDLDNLVRESRNGTDRIAKIVSDLKTFSRQDDSVRKETDLNAVIESALTLVWNEIKRNSEVEKAYGDLPRITANPQQLTQVFVNLLMNASQAIEGKGVIRIRTSFRDNLLCGEVSDTGSGMSPEILDRIFDPFFTTKEPGKGTGLGLSISNEIVKKHGGEIKVTSEAGKGSAFTVCLPIKSHGVVIK